jgi:exonuclease VII small subunit
MPNFDEAMNATEEMFANPPSAEEEPIVEETVEPPVEEAAPPTEPTPEDAVLDDAVNTAEVAAQVAQEKDTQLQQALQQIEALQAQNQQMQGAIEELSNKNEENLIEEAMQPPTLDINGLAFADEETIANELSAYAQKMSAYNRKEFEKEYEPVLEFAKKGMQEEEKARVLSDLSEAPELQGIKEMMPQIERIIANNKWLQSGDMPLDEKYVNAYAIARGVNAINTPPPEPQKELTSEELMQLYESNPAFQELVEKKRIDAIKNSQQVPPFSASSGAVNAALNIKEKPKTFDEAFARTSTMFGAR